MTLAVNKSERQTMIAANVGGQGMGRFKQRQAEVITYEIDYSGWLADAETITAATYDVAPSTTPAAVIVGSTISGGNTLLFQFDNGAEGTRYTINVTITTSTGQTKVDFFSLTVGTFSNESAQVDVVSASSTAVNAKAQAEAAATSAQTSATNAAASAATSLSGATTATIKAAEAAASVSTVTTAATNAANSATAAATSASNAATSATTANTKSVEASQYASSAAGSASLADQRATAAATSQSAASSSATSAATSASQASSSASSAANSSTTATTKAAEASASATSAASSAATATTKAGEASTSATSAATSATNASTSASNAATSATTATTQATAASAARVAAESARDATLAAYDSFDDRYLGAKASDPTVDNDGNALVGGTLYFNTTTQSMKLYTGAAWVNAYVSGDIALLKANNLSDLTNVATARSNLGLGTVAIENTVPVSKGGTGLTSLTAGRIPYGAGTGALGNSSALFWDATNKRFGIGRDTPAYSLDVTDLYNETNTIRIGSYNDNAKQWLLNNTNGLFTIDGSGAGSNIFTVKTVGSERMRIDASGNVGISTSSPAYKLHVIGSGYMSGDITAGTGLYSNDGTTISRVISSGGVSYWGTTSNHPTVFQTNNAERMRITAAGDVGIGTSSPSARLHTVRSSDGIVLQANGPVGNLTYSEYTGSSYFWNAGANLLFGTNTAHVLILGTNNAERMRIDALGNVGVGTSSPSERLHVQGRALIRGSTTGTQAALASDTTALSVVSGTGYNTTPSVSLTLGASNWDATNLNTGFQWVLTTPSTAGGASLAFSTRSYDGTSAYTVAERMRIDASGNVGIGVSNPSVRIEVRGTDSTTSYITQMLSSSTAGYGVFTQYTDRVNYNYAVGTDTNGDFTWVAGRYAGFAGTERMRLTQAGNVGINMVPATKFDIKAGGLNFPIARYMKSGSNNAAFSVYIDGADCAWFQMFNASNTETIHLQPNGDSWFSGGKLLIGTTTAGASKLTVADDSIQINTAKTPASATATGTAGQVCWDSSYIYVCTATNTWKRAALATW